jgi:tetratricopeptide (TPR) repeat protein
MTVLLLAILLSVMPLSGTAGQVTSRGVAGANAETLHKQGFDLFVVGKYEEALKFYLEELPLRRSSGDLLGEAWALNAIAECYDELGRPVEALDFYSRALPLSERLGIVAASPGRWEDSPPPTATRVGTARH